MSCRKKIESKETLKVFKTFDLLFMSMKSFKKYPKSIVFKKSWEPIQNWSQNIVQSFHFFLQNILVVLNKYNSYSSDGKNWLLHQNRLCQKDNFFTSIFSTFKIHYCWNFFTIRPTKNLRTIWTIDNKSLIRKLYNKISNN